MEFAALVAWVGAAVAGVYLLTGWLRNGGLREQATKVTRFPMLVVVGHPLSAVVGLVVWIAYLVTGEALYAWIAFGALWVVIFQGFLMLTRWLVSRGGRHARGAEEVFPTVAVLVHGAVAVTTFVLVFLVAIQVSRG